MEVTMARKTGIYAIVNLIDGKQYIGSSRNLAHRRRCHFSDLRIGRKEANRNLQTAYNLFGAEHFAFHVIEYLDENISDKELISREQFWMDTLQPEYNVNKIAGSFFGESAFTEEAKKKRYEKISVKLKGRKRIITWKNGMKGKKLTDAAKKHLSEINTGKRNPSFGLKRSDETRAKMSAKAAKTYTGFISPDGIVFAPIHNLRQFCKEHNLTESALRGVVSGKYSHHKGWKLVEDKCG